MSDSRRPRPSARRRGPFGMRGQRPPLTSEQRRQRIGAILATVRQFLFDSVRGAVRRPRSHSAAGITTDAAERRAQLSRMGLGAWVRVRLARLRARGKSEEQRKEIWDRVAVRTAQDAVEVLGNMKGVLMKVAQMASYDPGIPEGVQRQLSALQAAAPPMTAELAAECVERELGAPPRKVFKRWDAEPVASASIGQVHRAVTRDGREVAVKVQYPGVDDAIRADLQNAGMLANMVKAMSQGVEFDVDGLLREVTARLTDELDYRLEADNQRWFADRYRDHRHVKIASVVDELTTARVLTSEFVHGRRYADFVEGATQTERDTAGEIIHRFAFGSIFVDGVFTSDPHPGNYLFLPDGRVCFLDFGLIKRLDGDGERQAVRAPVEAVVRGERDALVPALKLSGWLTADAHPDPDPVWTLFELRFGPLASDEHRAYRRTGRRRRDSDDREAFLEAAEAVGPHLRFQPGLAFFLRYLGGISSLLVQLGSEGNWHRMAREVLFGDEPSTPIGTDWARAVPRR